MNRRHFLEMCAAAGTLAATTSLARQTPSKTAASDTFPVNGVLLPDDGWNLWIDHQAVWKDDAIFLPGTFKLASLPTNPPTGGWPALDQHRGDENSAVVTLPATVEQNFWAKYGTRPYTPDEYRYAADDAIPQNGAYEGVSWWWREIEIPSSMQGQRILLRIRGARMRAEVYLNEKLTGYSIMEELPFECDLTDAAKPGGANRLAIRITNPGGRYDWVDGNTIKWGKVNVYRSHGFGGMDRGLTMQAVPRSAHIADAWVLNTPEGRTVTAHASVEGSAGAVLFEVVDPDTGAVLAHANGSPTTDTGGQPNTVIARLSAPSARLWDLATPVLYHLRVTLSTGQGSDIRIIPFGFRWFAPEGLGTNALFRLNGRRIKLYSSISWGFWGFNGVWPTPELAEREVTQAKTLGLNCLNFHRNVGKEDVFREHDRLGLLRYMEPGAGKMAIGRAPGNPTDTGKPRVATEAELFSQQFMLAKCRAMVRAFRSHPSLIQYTLQNEIGADLKNPQTFVPLQVMHEEDPSRSVVLNDGFSPPPKNAPQAWYSPYNDSIHRSDQQEWAGWWNNHQGAGDQWYDNFYKDSTHFTYNQPLKTSLVEFGEMEGCAVADIHPLMIHQIETRQFGGNGKSYDLEDHRQIVASCERFLDRWGFRKAFPTPEAMYRSLGNKAYESWQQYLENIRICDEVDFGCISGWESTAIENHSGIVDNLRNFKGDPQLISSSLLPMRPVAKQHSLCCALGESATFDLFLLNDTGAYLGSLLRFAMIDPNGKITQLNGWPTPPNVRDQFSYAIEMDYKTSPLTVEGIYKFRFTCDEAPLSTFTREIWVANAQRKFSRKVKIAVSSALPEVRKQLAALPDVLVTDFAVGGKYDLIVSSGVVQGSKLDRKIGDETGLEAQPAKGAPVEEQPAGRLADEILAAVRAGTPLLAMVPDDFLADGVAKQLAAGGAFTYTGLVGDTRAPWMGNWLFVREHPTFAALPVNRALSVHYQAHGKSSNGLLIERAPGADDPEVIMAYSRDHDRQIGAASFTCRLGKGRVLLHRAPAFSAPLQQRWLANSIEFLTAIKSNA